MTKLQTQDHGTKSCEIFSASKAPLGLRNLEADPFNKLPRSSREFEATRFDLTASQELPNEYDSQAELARLIAEQEAEQEARWHAEEAEMVLLHVDLGLREDSYPRFVSSEPDPEVWGDPVPEVFPPSYDRVGLARNFGLGLGAGFRARRDEASSDDLADYFDDGFHTCKVSGTSLV